MTMGARHKLARTAFVTDRALEFFSESELTTQLGYGKRLWPLIIAKELIDNGLDFVESLNVAPVIEVELQENALIVSDNGTGIPAEVIEKSVDYSLRISDKKHYISPSRGQLGNALKCVWAAPFVATDGKGHAEIISKGVRHEISVSLNRISQRPDIHVSTQKLGSVKKSSSVRIDWNGIAGLEVGDEDSDFYPDGTFNIQLWSLLIDFAVFNPHAEFRLKLPGAKLRTIRRSDKSWVKWRTSDPTSPHWYRPEELRALIAAYISSREHKTVRDFVREFAGLSGTQYCKAVLSEAKLPDSSLSDLVSSGDVDLVRVGRLLDAMKNHSRQVNPNRLGVIGMGHFAIHALALGLTKHTMRYKKIVGHDEGLPFVIEVAFGLKTEGKRELYVGLNNSVVFKNPTDELSESISRAHIADDDPVILFVHLCSPRFEYLDHGKGSIVLGPEMSDALDRAIGLATKDFAKAKRKALKADRDRLTPAEVEELRVKEEKKKEKNQIKAAAYACMAQAYLKASDNGRLPANARQIMYAARPLILKMTGGKCWKNSATFTQMLLPDYQREHLDETRDWNVVYDARGRFREPHTGVNFGLGTLEVRAYCAAWRR